MGKVRYNIEIKEIIDGLLLDHLDVSQGKMFGYPAYYTNKKLFACVYEDALGIKVPFEFAKKLLEHENIVPFVPMGRRPMKEWIELHHLKPTDYVNDLDILKKSIEYVKTISK